MHDIATLVDRDPRFHSLQRARSRFAWSLATLVFAAFYAFMGTTAFRPAWLARPLHAETAVTVGLAALILRERLTRVQFLGLLSIFVGVVLIAFR